MCGCLLPTPTVDLASNPGMCPDWESNWQPFGLQGRAQSSELQQPGLIFCLDKLSIVDIVVFKSPTITILLLISFKSLKIFLMYVCALCWVSICLQDYTVVGLLLKVLCIDILCLLLWSLF